MRYLALAIIFQVGIYTIPQIYDLATGYFDDSHLSILSIRSIIQYYVVNIIIISCYILIFIRLRRYHRYLKEHLKVIN
jgi:amino acid transporter